MRRLSFVGVLVLVALSAAGAASPAGSGNASWVITDLGKDCSLVAINEPGQIVGHCSKDGQSRGFLWSNRKRTDLGTLAPDLTTEPFAINARGQIVGRAVRYAPEGNTEGVVESSAFLWEDGRIVKLKTLGGKGAGAQAERINDRGQIVGHSMGKNGQERAVLWENGHVTALWISSPGLIVAINDHRQITGTTSGNERALSWQNGRTRDLGTLGGKGSEARSINDRGQVVGSSFTARGTPHAFLWQKGKMVDLGALGRFSSGATAINDRGQIVGYTGGKFGESHTFVLEKGRFTDLDAFFGTGTSVGQPPGPTGAPGLNDRGQMTLNMRQHAFVWEDGRVTSLGTLGGNDTQAFAINNHDQIIGSSTTKNGTTHAVLWTLRPGR